jgi:hypothetical protein
MTTLPPPAPPGRSPIPPIALAALAVAACAAAPAVPATTVAERRTWPSEAELTRLQPADRYFNMGYNGEDLPMLLEPTAVKLFCEPVRRKPLRLRCRYALTVGDWIGADPPMKAVEDLVERDPAGKWKIVPCPLPGFIPNLGPRRRDPYAGC